MNTNVIEKVLNSVNIYSCCEAADSTTKDACCQVDGLKKNPPIWVPEGRPGPTGRPGPIVVDPVMCGKADGMHLTIKCIF